MRLQSWPPCGSLRTLPNPAGYHKLASMAGGRVAAGHSSVPTQVARRGWACRSRVLESLL